MTTLLPTPDLSATWIEALKQMLVRMSYHLCEGSRDLCQMYDTFWAMPDDQINATFAALGLDRSQLVFSLHNQAATCFNELNAILLASGFQAAPACATVAPRSSVVNASGNLELVPLVIPAETPITA